MKILFVSDAIYPYNKGGKEKRIHELATRLVKDGHDVHIFTMNWWQGAIIKEENKIILHGICSLKNLYTKGRRSIYQGIYFSAKLLKFLLKEKFDVLDVDETPFFPVYVCKLVALLKRKKLFATWHEVWGKKYWREYLGIKGFLAYYVEKYATRLPDIFLAVSDFTKKRLINYLHVPERKIVVIPNGIVIKEGLPETEKIYDIFFAGRLLTHKKVDLLIASIAEIKKTRENVKAIIIGQGPEKEKLLSLIGYLDLQKNIDFFDFLKEEDYFLKMRQSKIFISCSIREGFGITVLEAMAYGLPAIIINHPDNAATEIVRNGVNGCIVSLNKELIADKANFLLNDNLTYQKMHQAAVATGEKYNWDNSLKDLANIYQKSC